MKIYRNRITGLYRIVGQYGSTNPMATREEALEDYKRIKRNWSRRETNQILRDLTGTSARAARADMGLKEVA